ncbi:hypothetical protein NEH83_33315 [Streptomyces sp. JUS-F4]|uniref:hypothetical protein n=1 Tax=Streptomyces sp. JUS-F4 TaxID=2951988 RepID=UPI002664EAA5|nr:hypothetical protein [Streptomyces sp. JUS-F4]WKN18643.1 hypothetical protein NEH83_33315 [Streptomyces sp. JUS-F4]
MTSSSLAPDPVTECLSPQREDAEFTDSRASRDPRLNPQQSAEVISPFVALL